MISKSEYFICFNSGTKEYLSEAGITPSHLWFNDVGWVFSCPGGPSINKYGKRNTVENIELNLFAPIAKMGQNKFVSCAYKECLYIQTLSDTVLMALDYGPFILKRRVSFTKNGILFEDEFKFKTNAIFKELRYLNLPIVVDKFNIAILNNSEINLETKNGDIKLSVLDKNFSDSNFEILEKIKTAKGFAVIVSLRENNFKVQKSQKKHVTFSLTHI